MIKLSEKKKIGTHDEFKIIANGKELQFPLFRLIAVILMSFLMGGYFL
jgi:hypothetical protein